jgi:hypothetical protein
MKEQREDLSPSLGRQRMGAAILCPVCRLLRAALPSRALIHLFHVFARPTP